MGCKLKNKDILKRRAKALEEWNEILLEMGDEPLSKQEVDRGLTV